MLIPPILEVEGTTPCKNSPKKLKPNVGTDSINESCTNLVSLVKG